MFNQKTQTWISSIFIILLSCALLSCESLDDEMAYESEDTGDLELALTTQSSSGNYYRLRFADFEVTGGGQEITISTEDGPETDTFLQTSLIVGSYSVRLMPGWLLVKLDPASGEEQATQATLESDTVSLTISPNTVSYAEFRFVVSSDETVEFGDGRIGISVEDEREWDGGVPVDCGLLFDPANGIVGTPNGTELGETATYSCNSGYTLEGNVTRVCQSNGAWSGSAPTCEQECTYDETDLCSDNLDNDCDGYTDSSDSDCESCKSSGSSCSSNAECCSNSCTGFWIFRSCQ